ncbi:GntR family transcriptional regulator [Bradyrhizobium sp. RT11b]|uniref:GntR family transcriptional regulator n=1 Tax=Bradyrhizobium sp. RT11b TaxID=3156332 RepID=UPI0033985AC8
MADLRRLGRARRNSSTRFELTDKLDLESFRRELQRPIDRDGPWPLHEKVKRRLSEAIMLGVWSPGDLIPGEKELAQNFQIAVGTVRVALAELVAEGLLTRRRRAGTTVTGRTPHQTLSLHYQYFRLHGADGSLQSSITPIVDVALDTATERERQVLRLPDAAEVIRLTRLRIVAHKPIMVDRYTIPRSLAPRFPIDRKKAPNFIFAHLLENYGIRIVAVREEVYAELATSFDRKHLNLRGPVAVLVIDETAFDPAGTPCLTAHHRARTDNHRYVNEVR